MTEQSFLLTCREAANKCPNLLTRKLLRDDTDALAVALKTLTAKPTPSAMREVVALWTRAHVLLQHAHPLPDPIPPQASAERELLAA